MKVNSKSSFLFFIIALLFILTLGNALPAFSQNLLEAVAIQYKVPGRMPDDNYDFVNLVPYEKAKRYELVADGGMLQELQPVSIVKNVSDRQLNFRVRFRIINTEIDRILYNRLVPVNAYCLSLPDSLLNKCTGNPDVKIRYCKITKTNLGYNTEYLPFPGPDSLTGLPPGGYVEIHFSPFWPSEFCDIHFGTHKSCMMIDPTDPETKEELGEGDLSDDTLCIDLKIRRPEKIELYLPWNEELLKYCNVTFVWTSVYQAIEYEIQISQNINFDNPDYSFKLDENTYKGYKIINNFKLDINTKYYWKVKVICPDTTVWSRIWSFTTGDLINTIEDNAISNIPEVNTFPNPFNDYCRIKISNADKIRIFNLYGEKIWEAEIPIGDILPEEIIWKPDKNLSDGVYLLLIQYSSGFKMRKIIYLK